MRRPEYTPTRSLTPEAIERIRAWHERAYRSLRERPSEDIEILGLRLTVPSTVFPPNAMSDLLGQAVLDQVREHDRVLDMGTGSGINAILAASRSRDVLGVDINPDAVACARVNAERNDVAGRTRFDQSDVFDRVEGNFDLIVFDPPFRWFCPRDALEAAITDENYGALARFMAEAPARLRSAGRILMFFGSSGDLDHLRSLIDATGLRCDVLAQRTLHRDGQHVDYFTFRLTRNGTAG
jgi:release factor glutamine methyltransferase